jgi:ATP-dependent RNA circularization protein (DNA/RNA ligase family)
MAGGANTTDEYVKNGIKSISEGMKTLKDASEEDKKLFVEVFKKLGSSIGISTREKIQEQWSLNVKDFMNGIKESGAEKIAELKGE